MADFLDEKRNEIGARMKELRPLVEEYHRVKAAGRRRSAGTGTGRRGRPKGSGTRGAEALALVKASPGITIPEIAEKMGIKQNYLYRVLPGLAEDGLVIKEGRGWKPKDAA